MIRSYMEVLNVSVGMRQANAAVASKIIKIAIAGCFMARSTSPCGENLLNICFCIIWVLSIDFIPSFKTWSFRPGQRYLAIPMAVVP